MPILLNSSVKTTIEVSRNIDSLLMVCSHERSGTHFLMNSISNCTDYTSEPWLDYDLVPFGGVTNFFNEKSTNELIRRLANMDTDEKQVCASILKSHFPLSLLGEEIPNLPIKIIYIYRDPVEVITSLWKLFHEWDWLEGAKTNSPLDLAKHIPIGQSQRFQKQTCPTYFIRWASHVKDGITASLKSNNVTAINYKNLLKYHDKVITKACLDLGINLLSRPIKPIKETSFYVKSKELHVNHSTHQALRKYCSEELVKFPKVKEALEN